MLRHLRRMAAVAGLALLIYVPLVPRPADAEIAGQTDPSFEAALGKWLDGDEAEALPAFAVQAKAGNAAAQMLLGMIDHSPDLQGRWVAALGPAERIALMRAPGGMSGLNWMGVAARTEPLAGLLAAVEATDAPPSIVLNFVHAGEARAARAAVVAIRARNRAGLGGLLGDPAFPKVMTIAAWPELEGGDAAKVTRFVEALDPGDPQRDLWGGNLDAGALARWLQGHPAGLPLVALCRAVCPNEPPESCLPAAFHASGGYLTAMSLGSPIETLVPPERFAASVAGHDAVLRRIAFSRIGMSGLQCLDTAVAATN